MDPHHLWHTLPSPVRAGLRHTPVFEAGRRLNDWLWRGDRYTRLRYDFVRVPVSVGDVRTELHLPESKRPWWREYDRCGCHEPLASETLLRALEDGDTFWDLGSRFGYFSTIGAVANGAPERIHVFEPRVSNWRLVEENNRALFGGAVHVNNVAVGADDTDRTVSGDTYANAHGPPDVVKMDVEGAEVAALRGMGRLLETHRPVLLVEGHPELIAGHGSGDTHTDTDDRLLELLRTHYDDVRISFDFRSPEGQWRPVTDYWDRRFERRSLSEGEFDRYQLYCRP